MKVRPGQATQQQKQSPQVAKSPSPRAQAAKPKRPRRDARSENNPPAEGRGACQTITQKSCRNLQKCEDSTGSAFSAEHHRRSASVSVAHHRSPSLCFLHAPAPNPRNVPRNPLPESQILETFFRISSTSSKSLKHSSKSVPRAPNQRHLHQNELKSFGGR